MTTPLFRWTGAYWGFVADGRLYDRYGRDVGWLEGVDVYDRSGRFLGELRERYHVLRSRLRAEPVHRATRPAIPYLTPPDPLPDHDARDPLDDWRTRFPGPCRLPIPPRDEVRAEVCERPPGCYHGGADPEPAREPRGDDPGP